MLTGPAGPVTRHLIDLGDRVRNQSVVLCPYDTGRLSSSITSVLENRSGTPVAVVGTNVSYARAVHNGTGIYGSRGTPITPTSARFLKFTPKGSTRPVFARSVKGVRPRPFLTDALDVIPAATT